MYYYIYWTDPDDPDQGTNTGFEMFDKVGSDRNKDDASRFINKKIKLIPNSLKILVCLNIQVRERLLYPVFITSGDLILQGHTLLFYFLKQIL